jgi:hypothetical protein
MMRVGTKTAAFAAVYDRYPNKDGKNAAADAFQAVAESYPGGENALRDVILAWFETGVLNRHPYGGGTEPRFRPKLEKVIGERRWEDARSAPADVAPPRADPNCKGWHAGGKNTGRRNPRGQQATCPECKSVYLREWTADDRVGDPTPAGAVLLEKGR